jgi:xanthine dehydrogenase accessory factor
MTQPVRAQQRTAATVRDWLQDGHRVAAGILIGVDGSAPFAVGASVFVRDDGVIEGSITGGCVESAVADEGLGVLAGRGEGAAIRRSYGISDELAGTVGLMCGGTVEVFIAQVVATAGVIAGLAAVAAGEPVTLATVLDGPDAGAMIAITAGGVLGELSQAEDLEPSIARLGSGLLAQGGSVVRSVGPGGSLPDDGVNVHFTAIVEAPRMLIIGATNFSAALAALAGAASYRVIIADPRTSFVTSPRFTAVAEVREEWPRPVIEQLAPGPRDAVVVLSHDPKLDTPALLAAFASEAGYIGALGSRRTAGARSARLLESGATHADLARLHAPAGLDIGAATSEETAIAILAEVVSARAGRSGLPLRETDGPIRVTARSPIAP